MRRSVLLAIGTGILAAALTPSSRGAEGDVGEVDFPAPKARFFPELAVDPAATTPRGYVNVATLEPTTKKWFLYVPLELRPYFRLPTGGEIRIAKQNIYLKARSGRTFVPIGESTPDGRFTTRFEGFRYRGTGNDGSLSYGLVFLVPQDIGQGKVEYTLYFGNAKRQFQIDVDANPKTLDRAEIAEFSVERWKWKLPYAPEIARNRIVGPPTLPEGRIVETIRSPLLDERLLIVDYKIKPKAANFETGFRMSTSDLGLWLTARRLGLQPISSTVPGANPDAPFYVAPIGYLDNERFRDGATTIESKRDYDGTFPELLVSVVFLFRWDRSLWHATSVDPPEPQVKTLDTIAAKFDTYYLMSNAKAPHSVTTVTQP